MDGTDMVARLSGKMAAAVAALIALAACPLAPRASADATAAPVLVQTPGILCALSANDVARGGGPTLACQLLDNGPFPQAPFSETKPNPKLNLAVIRGGGQFTWELGSVAGPQPLVLAPGQTYHANGWTVESANLRSTYVNDVSGHGLWIGPDFVHPN
jgi:hypothetical protein